MAVWDLSIRLRLGRFGLMVPLRTWINLPSSAPGRRLQGFVILKAFQRPCEGFTRLAAFGKGYIRPL